MNRLVSLLVLLAVACTRAAPSITLATTTSVANSGLLDRVLPAYPVPVRPLPVGSGLALNMLASGQADAALSHAPERETDFLRAHPSTFYRKILYNDFLIVGPEADFAGVASTADAVAAMQRIAQSEQRFLSRGDESGTHERERQLWKAAGVPVPSPHVVVAGAGMGQTLRIASAMQAYTLTDRGTYEALKGTIRLRVLVTGDPRLVNTYAVIAPSDNEQGLRFARWLAGADGRRILANVVGTEVKGLFLWPEGVPGDRPDAVPDGPSTRR